jgi:hypothetical protein
MDAVDVHEVARRRNHRVEDLRLALGLRRFLS